MLNHSGSNSQHEVKYPPDIKIVKGYVVKRADV